MARVIDTRRSRVFLGGLVLAHVIVVSGQVDGGGGASLLERAVFAALSPLQRAVGAAVRGVRHSWYGYVDLRGARTENERLEERIRVLETLLQERQHQAREAERLRELLGLRQVLPVDTIVAEVVARDGVPWFRNITVDKGLADGVELYAPVLSPSGVVGRVVAVGPTAAKVQLLLDRDAGVGVLIERSRVTGVLGGQLGSGGGGSTDLTMKYVPALADVAVGDVVVTSGLDGIFPKGFVVGRVRSVGPASGLFREVAVTPSARFGRLEEVLVVRSRTAPPAFTESVR
jgi:rod shape-determining protein MreC